MCEPSQVEVDELHAIACQLRLDSLEMIHRRRNGHPGGSLSIAEILSVLYFRHLRIRPGEPGWTERDRFILSKGHASAILYAALARRGYFPLEDLALWGQLDAHLQAHPDRLKTPGVDMTTGLLGHGVSIGVGLALSARARGLGYRPYVLLGDGECQAGVIWEGAMAAGKFGLDNLTVIVDANGIQLDGPVAQVMPLEPLAEKWRAFRFEVCEIDGHDVRQVISALALASQVAGQPTAVIARTVKGKGVSFMENRSRWHGIAPSDSEYAQASAELEAALAHWRSHG
jgi:transketolase